MAATSARGVILLAEDEPGVRSVAARMLRDGLEDTYRVLAGATTDQRSRYDLVDKANAVRRWTLR